MSYNQILDINFSTLYFSFPYDLLPSVTFLSMNESYYCTDRQVSQVHQHISCIISREILKHFFLNSSIKSFNDTRFFFVFRRKKAQLVFGHLYYRIPDLYLPTFYQVCVPLRCSKMHLRFPVQFFMLTEQSKQIQKIYQLQLASILFHCYLLTILACLLNQQPKFHRCCSR